MRRLAPAGVTIAAHEETISDDGFEPLQKASLDSTWQPLIQLSLSEEVITPDGRFSLHDIKRKGGTDTIGNRADRQDALEVSDAMMKAYEKRAKSKTIALIVLLCRSDAIYPRS